MQEQVQVVERKRMSARTVALIVATALLTTFAVMNRSEVYVWPLGMHSVIVVILISFLLGGIIGWLAKSIFSPHRLIVQERD
jgi:uncharacterized integral membrane protein